MIAFLKLYVCEVFSPITFNELLSTKYASPRTISTLFPFNKPSTPPINFLTTPALNACTFEKSTVTFSALIPYGSECFAVS